MNTIEKFLTELESHSLEGKTDVISLLKSDHRKVDVMFAEYKNASRKAQKAALLQAIIKELTVHASVEEKLVYPELEHADNTGANEAYEEHHVVKLVLSELSKIQTIDDKIDAKVSVLAEMVKHHVQEEENKLLPELKDSGADMDALGQAVLAEKNNLMSRYSKKSPSRSRSIRKTNARRKAS